MKEHGNFEHNRQSLRIVDVIECPYPNFTGLNLMFETRLGLMKHSSPYDKPESDPDWPKHPSLEAQIADIADRIAYNCHDLEDGLRSRLIDEKQLANLQLYQQACEKARMDEISDYVIRRTRITKTMLDILTGDTIETSKANLAAANIQTLEEVLNRRQMLIDISQEADAALRELETFLMQNMYLNPAFKEANEKAKRSLADLFGYLCDHPDKMPHYYQQMIETEGLQRTVCDYISGMTDRYCLTTIEQLNIR
jgi:dGTPase